MAVTNYYSFEGEIIGERTVGQSRLDYLPDALGSVVATVDQTLTVTSTARFKPYGADLATTGTMPMYGWVGSLGSRRTYRPHTDIYNRARHLGSQDGRWSTVDFLWPVQSPYVYVYSRPTIAADPLGSQSSLRGLDLWPCNTTNWPRPGGPVECTPQWNKYIYCLCNTYPGLVGMCDSIASQYYAKCYAAGKKPQPGWPYPWPPSHVFPFQPKPGGGEVAPYPLPPTSGAVESPPCNPECYDLCGDRWRRANHDCFQNSAGSGPSTTTVMPISFWWCEAIASYNYLNCVSACDHNMPPPPPVFTEQDAGSLAEPLAR